MHCFIMTALNSVEFELSYEFVPMSQSDGVELGWVRLGLQLNLMLGSSIT